MNAIYNGGSQKGLKVGNNILPNQRPTNDIPKGLNSDIVDQQLQLLKPGELEKAVQRKKLKKIMFFEDFINEINFSKHSTKRLNQRFLHANIAKLPDSLKNIRLNFAPHVDNINKTLFNERGKLNLTKDQLYVLEYFKYKMYEAINDIILPENKYGFPLPKNKGILILTGDIFIKMRINTGDILTFPLTLQGKDKVYSNYVLISTPGDRNENHKYILATVIGHKVYLKDDVMLDQAKRNYRVMVNGVEKRYNNPEITTYNMIKSNTNKFLSKVQVIDLVSPKDEAIRNIDKEFETKLNPELYTKKS